MTNEDRDGCFGCGCKRCVPCGCGVLLIAILLLFVYFATGFTPRDLWLTLTKPKRPFETSGCMENLRRIGTAMSLYLESADAFPPKEVWMDELFRYAKRDDMLEEEAWKLFRCPTLKGGDEVYGYAMNSVLSARLRPLKENEKEWQEAVKTPAVFDSQDTKKNAHGPPDKLAPRPGRHEGKNHALYADGHVADLPTSP